MRLFKHALYADEFQGTFCMILFKERNCLLLSSTKYKSKHLMLNYAQISYHDYKFTDDFCLKILKFRFEIIYKKLRNVIQIAQ
jgi:hypothetical protein